MKSEQNKKNENVELELGEDSNFELPKKIKLVISLPILFILLFVIFFYGYLILFNPKYLNPGDYGLASIFSTLLIILIVINIPLHKMGFTIKKIGAIELERVVKNHAKSSSNELADLQREIDNLKLELKRYSNNAELEKELDLNSKLDDLITRFLTRYSMWAFSALRIKNWGSLQTGFEELKSFETQQIRESLRRLLSKGIIVSRISSKGNTIYTKG